MVFVFGGGTTGLMKNFYENFYSVPPPPLITAEAFFFELISSLHSTPMVCIWWNFWDKLKNLFPDKNKGYELLEPVLNKNWSKYA